MSGPVHSEPCVVGHGRISYGYAGQREKEAVCGRMVRLACVAYISRPATANARTKVFFFICRLSSPDILWDASPAPVNAVGLPLSIVQHFQYVGE